MIALAVGLLAVVVFAVGALLAHRIQELTTEMHRSRLTPDDDRLAQSLDGVAHAIYAASIRAQRDTPNISAVLDAHAARERAMAMSKALNADLVLEETPVEASGK